MNFVVKKAIISEKAAILLKDGKYSFLVEPSANKSEIKKFVEKRFSVKVKSVNVLNIKGKERRKGAVVGRTKNKRKAIVTVSDGQQIEEIKSLY